jgi:hypothetical protein
MRPVIDELTDYSKVTWRNSEADRCNQRWTHEKYIRSFCLDSEYVRNDSNSTLSKYGKYFVDFLTHSGRIMCQGIGCWR